MSRLAVNVYLFTDPKYTALQNVPSKVATGNAFEDVLYGSQSELDDSDDEGSIIATGNTKKNIQDVRLRLDDDEPMNLLEGAAMRITGLASVIDSFV